MDEEMNFIAVMQYLPIEMVTHILTFLPNIEDRKAVSLTCKNWNTAYQSPIIKRMEVLDINTPQICDTLTELPTIKCLYTNVNLRGLYLGKSIKEFWSIYAPYFENIRFYSCQIQESNFIKLITKCEELRHLTIQDCDELFMCENLFEKEDDRALLRNTLEDLKSLNLGYNRYMYDIHFVRFTSLCPNIDKLFLSGCYIAFHESIYRKFYTNGHNEPSSSILTFNVIHDYIKKQAAKLKVLSLSDTLIDSVSLVRLLSTPDLLLNELHLQHCMELSNDSLSRIPNHQHNLTFLDIGHCPKLNDDAVICICTNLTELKHFSIEGCKNVTDESISELWRLTEIVTLNISECEKVTDEGVMAGLGSRLNPNLKDLNLSHLRYLTENAVVKIVGLIPNLRVFNLGYSFRAITDTSVQSICLGLKYLTKLSLARGDKLTDRGVTGVQLDVLSNDFSTLAELNSLMKKLYDITDADFGETEEEQSYMRGHREPRAGSFRQLENLQQLNLSGCICLTDLSLIYGIRAKELRSLDISFCSRITDDGLKLLSECNRSLEIVNIDNCIGTTDEGVGFLINNLKRLKKLILGSPYITDRILGFLKAGKSNLTFMDLRHCCEIKQDTVENIIRENPSMFVMHLSHKGTNTRPPGHRLPPLWNELAR